MRGAAALDGSVPEERRPVHQIAKGPHTNHYFYCKILIVIFFIEPTIVDAKSKTAIFVQYKKHRFSIRGNRQPNVAMLKHVLDAILFLFDLEPNELVDWLVNEWSIVLQFDLQLMAHLYQR